MKLTHHLRLAMTNAAEYLEKEANDDRIRHKILGKSYSYTGTKGDRIGPFESVARSLREIAAAI